ncbi:Nucleotide exchange factor GrpE [Frankia sp. AiPs1]|uniref:hypothetical protein n=1 Tax=Frankia sp. AiPa1 TaxID=573492 RepID=UPI00202B718F|nr:hypothetical protein [Frankia sp. AiPa1]MCL9762715.1 hypothetical protein [Frankia sp. AiPa1]
MVDVLRQWRHPREFRIARPSIPDAWATLLAQAGEIAPEPTPQPTADRHTAPLAGQGQGQPEPDAQTRPDTQTGPDARAEPDAPPALAHPAVAELATGLWRLRRRFADPTAAAGPATAAGTSGRPGSATPISTGAATGAADGAGTADNRRLRRQLDSLWSTLTAAGVDVQDHDHARYDSGLDLAVLEFQQTSGLTGETVLETLRPSVYLHGRRVQTGEVVVGVPVGPHDVHRPGQGGEQPDGERRDAVPDIGGER